MERRREQRDCEPITSPEKSTVFECPVDSSEGPFLAFSIVVGEPVKLSPTSCFSAIQDAEPQNVTIEPSVEGLLELSNVLASISWLEHLTEFGLLAGTLAAQH